MRTKPTSIRSAVVLAVLSMFAAVLFNTSPAGSQDQNAAGSSGEDPVGAEVPSDPGLSAADTAALEAEMAAELGADVVMTGTPIVPQGTNASLDDGEARVDDNQAGIVVDSQPAQGATASPNYLEAEAGTSSTISFAESGSVADLLAADVQFTEAVQEEIDDAKRSRVVSIAADGLAADLAAESVTVELFDGVSLDLTTNVAPSDGQLGSTVWSALPAEGADGDPFGIVTMIDGRVYGGFWQGNTAYEIVPLGNGDHLLFEVGREFEGDPEHWDMPSGPDNGPSGLTGAELGIDEGADLALDTISAPNVDIMVAYDAEVATALGSHQAAVDLAILNVNLMNITYINAGAEAPQNATLTNVYATGYTPTTTNGVLYRDQMANKTDGTFDAIHTQRDANYADMVVLLFNRTMFSGSTSLCGIAYFPTSANPAENDAYQITKRNCATTTALTFPHEFGHNQCAGHDTTGGGCSFYTNDMGYSDAGNNKRTIMARNSQPGIRQPVWSNPSITFNGWTPGVANTDNNFVLEQEDLAPGTVSGGVANYRVNPLGSNTAVAGTDGISCAFNTIEDAITLAPPGSTIYVAPGTYPAQSAGLNYNIAKDLDLVQGTSLCEPAASPTATGVILQRGAGATADAVLEISGAGTEVTVDRITIEGSTGTEGNVQVFAGATLTLDDAIVRNAATTADGGGIRVLSGGTLTLVDNTQVENNATTGNGGGVWTDGGTVNLNGQGDIDNNSATSGGGIYATNGATVTMDSDADILANSATNGGGVYLDNSSMAATGSGAFIGLTGSNANTAVTGGGGVFVNAGGSISLATGAQVNGNVSSSFAGGVRLTGDGSTLTVNDGGSVLNNDATGIGGGGVYASSTGSIIDLNRGSTISGNDATTGFGGGIVSFGFIDADGASGTVDFVDIANNTAATTGGGLHVGGTANLDTVHVTGNSAATGGGAHVLAAGTLNVAENFICDIADTAFEQYCNEFRGNSATTHGSAVSVDGGTLNVDTTGFIANTTANNVVRATGAADVDIRAAMFLNNTTGVVNDGMVTAIDTANINIVGVTFADNDDRAMDSDSVTSVWNVARVITDSGLYNLDNATGSCNIRFPGTSGSMPGQVSVDPRFETSDDTAYMPGSHGPAADRCALLGGHASDALDEGVKDGDGVASATEYDVGGIEAIRQPLLTPGSAIVAEGNAGLTVMSLPVTLDISSSEVISIDWQTVSPAGVGWATADVDYIADSGTVTFLPGSTQEFIDVSIIGDVTPETSLLYGEWFLVTYSNITENAEFDTDSFFGVGVGIIFNDDGPVP